MKHKQNRHENNRQQTSVSAGSEFSMVTSKCRLSSLTHKNLYGNKNKYYQSKSHLNSVSAGQGQKQKTNNLAQDLLFSMADNMVVMDAMHGMAMLTQSGHHGQHFRQGFRPLPTAAEFLTTKIWVRAALKPSQSALR
jgi:hypothetical protein